MKRVITIDHCTNMPVIKSEVLKDLELNNTAFPDIKRIIYNIGKKSYRKLDENGKTVRDENGKIVMSEPVDVLATVVYFVDDTKISVVNSAADGVKFEDHVLSNGSSVKVASRESKEMGLVYAIVKRLLTKYDENGKPLNSATGRILNDYVKGSYDCTIEKAELKIARAKSKAEHDAKLNTAKPKKRYSIAETLARINEMLDKADGPKAEGLINKIAAIFKD
jgi:hypothetical protein